MVKVLLLKFNNGKKVDLNCKKINANEIIGLEHSGTTPNEVLDIYKKYKVSQMLKMSKLFKVLYFGIRRSRYLCCKS